VYFARLFDSQELPNLVFGCHGRKPMLPDQLDDTVVARSLPFSTSWTMSATVQHDGVGGWLGPGSDG
jgi:hypothetical protein